MSRGSMPGARPTGASISTAPSRRRSGGAGRMWPMNSINRGPHGSTAIVPIAPVARSRPTVVGKRKSTGRKTVR
jgi:hypothetical protein